MNKEMISNRDGEGVRTQPLGVPYISHLLSNADVVGIPLDSLSSLHLVSSLSPCQPCNRLNYP